MDSTHRQAQYPQGQSAPAPQMNPTSGGEPGWHPETHPSSEQPQKSQASQVSGPGQPMTPVPTSRMSQTSRETRARVSMQSLPPPPEPTGLARLLSLCFGGPLMPLRFLWSFARWFWFGVGLLVIGAAAVDYLMKLITGNLPSVTEAFFSSPVLEVPSRHPLRFLAVMALILVLTVLAWGAAREHRRRVNARAERVRQAVRGGLLTEQFDEEMHAALAAGDSYENFRLATQLHEQGRAPDAIWFYQLVLEHEPKHFGANYNLGLLYAELEQFEAAEGHCRTAILLNPESAEAQGLTAYVLYRLGFLEEAQRRARLAVRMGFSSQLLESLILPGLGMTGSMPAIGSGAEGG